MILKEFKEFLKRGNIIDLAAAVVMGSAFTRIISSFISDLLNPLLLIISRDTDLKNLTFTVGKATFCYGAFLQSTIDFFTLALFLFIFLHLARKIAAQVEEKVIDPVDEQIVTPFETKILGRERKASPIEEMPLNKDNLVTQVQEDLKNKQKSI